MSSLVQPPEPASDRVIAAHLRELEIALNLADVHRLLPPRPAPGSCVLDIGCGIGQTLIAMGLEEDCTSVGIDVDEHALAYGLRMAPKLALACASGESLPFRSQSFDVVVSRVALPYMRIPVALAEIARVLNPGGSVWLVLHPFTMLSWRHALSGLRQLAFELYRLTNSLSLAVFGQQFAYPLKPSITESYQTDDAMRRCLERSGFTDIRFSRDRHFLVTARRLEHS